MKINLKITSEDTNIDLIAVRSRDMHGLSINHLQLTCDSANKVHENRVKVFEMWARRKLNFPQKDQVKNGEVLGRERVSTDLQDSNRKKEKFNWICLSWRKFIEGRRN